MNIHRVLWLALVSCSQTYQVIGEEFVRNARLGTRRDFVNNRLSRDWFFLAYEY